MKLVKAKENKSESTVGTFADNTSVTNSQNLAMQPILEPESTFPPQGTEDEPSQVLKPEPTITKSTLKLTLSSIVCGGEYLAGINITKFAEESAPKTFACIQPELKKLGIDKLAQPKIPALIDIHDKTVFGRQLELEGLDCYRAAYRNEIVNAARFAFSRQQVLLTPIEDEVEITQLADPVFCPTYLVRGDNQIKISDIPVTGRYNDILIIGIFVFKFVL